MSHVPKYSSAQTDALRLWPLVHLVVELAQRHGPPAPSRTADQSRRPLTTEASKQTQSSDPDNEIRPGPP
jgi:hypothetical protein